MNASVLWLLVHVVVLSLAVGRANGQSTLPDARWGQAATVFGTTVLVHGGKTDPNHEYSYTSAPNSPQLMSLDLASSFNLDSPPWQTLSATSSPALAFHTITAYSQSELLFFGGDPGPSYPLSTRNDSAGSMWLNGNAATWTTHPENWANQPLRREFHSAASWYGKIIITGGEKVDGSGLAFKEPYLYDSGSSQFTQLSSDNGPPDLIGHASLILSNETLLVLGGYSNSLSQLQPLSTIYTLNISSNTWSSFNVSGDTVPGGRRNFAAVMLGDSQFLIQGGADGSLENGLSDGFIFDLNAKTWTNVSALAGVGARWDHTVFTAGSQVFFAFGYTSSGAASNQLLLFDTSSSQFISQFTPASPMAWADINSPIIYPPSSGGGGNGGGDNSGGNTGTTGPDQGGSNSTDGNPSTHSSTPTPQQQKQSSTPLILGSLFGGLAAAAAVVFIVIFYRRRRRTHRRGWSGNTEESEKAVMVGGFQPVPHSRTYGLMTRVLHIPTHTQYSQAPRRERFDILADDDNTEYEYGAMGTRPGTRRKGTSGSGSTYFGAGRWNSRGGTQSAIGSLVNASVSSFRSVLGFGVVQNNIARSPSREGKRESSFPGMGVSTKNLVAPPSAWRRGSSYGSNYPGDSYTAGDREDPFGDEHGIRPVSEYGVEEEYQKAMMMQHEMLRRASSSGPEEYSALILNRRTSESGTPIGERPPSLILNKRPSDGPSISDSNQHDLASYIRGGIPLEPVVSISDPSTSHAHSEDTHTPTEDRHDITVTSHNTSLRTPEERYIPRVYSPNSFQYHQLQRNTSGGSRIGASLTRTMSAISSLFGGGYDNHGGVGRRETGRRRGSYSKSPGGGFLGGGGGGYVTAEYTDIRDPNPPPPDLGAKLISIEEGGESRQASGSNEPEAPPAPIKSQTNPTSKHAQYPSLVLRPLHEKSLSSLRTANSEALERLGTGNWDVVQRMGTSSSRQTNTTDTTDESSYTHLGGEAEMGWRDVMGRKAEGPSTIVESPVDLEARERTTRFGQSLSIPQPLSPTSPTANTSTSPSGPRPIPPQKRVTQSLAQRIEALGMAKEVSPTSPTKPPSDAGKRTPAVYGLAPKPTLFIANPSARGTSDST